MRGEQRYKQDVQYEIDAVAQSHELPDDLVEVATTIYDQFHSEKYAHSREPRTYAAASLILAARMEDYPLQIRDLIDAFEADPDDEWYNDSRLNQIARAKRRISGEIGINTTPTNPAILVTRYADELDLSDDDRETVSTVAQEMIENWSEGSGHAPSSVAAAAIYAAIKLRGIKITQSDVSNVTDVSEVTIRNIYTEQLEAYQKEVM